MRELTAQAFEADNKPVAPLTAQEYVQRIEIQLGMIEAMIVDTREIIHRFKQEHSKCQPCT